ncbi:MAG: protein-L-isoaspartate(D-aspartate) O-methyltransferase [Anaerolineales bacterium]|nr:protein-L-isoaspartate(D-aspartate) O-methyltransferase [Anaerolineales bacterium]
MVDESFAAQRDRMIAEQLVARGIVDTAVLHAFHTIPREQFVPPAYRAYAYDDTPLPIPADQTISQPYVVAYMLSLVYLSRRDRVLEIGAGSGYAAALLSQIVAEVYTVERHAELVAYARQRIAELALPNVWVRHGDGSLGWPAHAPYDAILVAAGGPEVPASLKAQLALNGRLIMPVGRSQRRQRLVLVCRRGDTVFEESSRAPVAFVPLIGQEGWES